VRDVDAGMAKWVVALRLTGVGFFISICILGGALGGLWLDEKLATKPIFMIIGLLAGLGVAGYGVYQMIRPLISNSQDKESN
jgi:ATP synthase protein I